MGGCAFVFLLPPHALRWTAVYSVAAVCFSVWVSGLFSCCGVLFGFGYQNNSWTLGKGVDIMAVMPLCRWMW